MGGRFQLKKYLIIRLLEQQLPEFKFNIELDFPFNPKHIPKVPQRRVRKACYQSFALYKKSFKPKCSPRFRFIKDEWAWGKHDDHIDAISHLFCDDNFIEFELLGHVFGIVKNENWQNYYENYIDKSQSLKENFIFSHMIEIDYLIDIDLALTVFND